MRVNGKHYRTIWLEDDDEPVVKIIDQRFLPHRFVVENIPGFSQMVRAIEEMHLRGAGLVGVSAAFAVYLAARECSSFNFRNEIVAFAERLLKTRPTAVNLQWAVNRQLSAISTAENLSQMVAITRDEAIRIADEDAANCRTIGTNGASLIAELAARKEGKTLNVLTHCNAGWLAFTDYGTALSPIFEAARQGVRLHVWVDETRPRNQGASLTAWELLNENIPHTLIADNTGGHLMQNGMVDLVITGADRITANGDVANKIGTYLKALAAADNAIPFYVAAPLSTFDCSITYGVGNIPIEERDPDEVRYVHGLLNENLEKVLIAPENTPAANFGFDVTPARLITGIVTERGICSANRTEISKIITL